MADQNLPAVAPAPSLLMDPTRFEHAQRVGKMLAISPLFPEHLRKGSLDQSLANAVLVLNMADRLREDPLTVAQNIYFVGGKPGWAASYMIAKANQHGIFAEPIDWESEGKGDTLSVTAFVILARSGKRRSVTLSMATAKAEGWTKNSKYQTMPEQMLRYRTATFLIRLYCPEVMVGVPAGIELELGGEDYAIVEEKPAEEAAPKPKAAAAKPAETPAAPKPKLDPKAEEAETVAEETPHDADGVVTEEVKPAPTTRAEVKAQHAEPRTIIDPDQAERLISIVKTEIEAIGDKASINEVLDLYGVELEGVRTWNPDRHAQLMKEIEDRRDSLPA